MGDFYKFSSNEDFCADVVQKEMTGDHCWRDW